ncbi:MAG: class I SAM-dependent methyltransferase [Anaerolineales bacterium]
MIVSRIRAGKQVDGKNPYLWPMLRSLPYFRALLRAVEAGFYDHFDLKSPVLDLGSGDGQFAQVVFHRPIDVGLDPEFVSLREAKRSGAYRSLVQALGSRIPYPDAYFSSAFSNSVLEHIPNLQEVLDETARVLKPGSLFLFCVPNHRWPENLEVSGILRLVGLKGLAVVYVRLFTRITRHIHMLSPGEWERRLNEAGFEMERFWHYFPPAALHALEWGHYFGLPSWVARELTGRWVLAPARWNLALTERAVRKHTESGVNEQGTYTWYVARRK